MNISNIIKYPLSRLFSFVSDFSSRLNTDQKLTVLSLSIFALYMTFCTCRYLYHHSKPLKDGKNRTIDFFGSVRSGEFKNGQLNGKGRKEFFGPLRQEAVGEFKDDKLNGPGKITSYPDWFWSTIFGAGEEEAFREGDFKDDLLNGKGIVQGTKHRKYLFFGPIVPGRRDEGYFKNGFLHGVAKRVFPWAGYTEEGPFKRDQLHGKGKRTYDNGKVEDGNFEYGKFVDVG